MTPYINPGHVNERTPQFRRRKSGKMEGPPTTSAFLEPEPPDQFSFNSNLAIKMAPPKNWALLGSQFNYNIDNLVQTLFPVQWNAEIQTFGFRCAPKAELFHVWLSDRNFCPKSDFGCSTKLDHFRYKNFL